MRVRLRPVLMTSLATIIGMVPMAMALEAGSEQYAPLARAIIGGLTLSVIVTVFVVPAAYLWVHRKEEQPLRNHPWSLPNANSFQHFLRSCSGSFDACRCTNLDPRNDQQWNTTVRTDDIIAVCAFSTDDRAGS